MIKHRNDTYVHYTIVQNLTIQKTKYFGMTILYRRDCSVEYKTTWKVADHGTGIQS